MLLRLFGARVGKSVVIRSRVFIQFPWKLSIGDNAWIGDEAYLLNLEHITIGANACISQRAFLCTGSHDYRKTTFDLIVKPITIEEGVWLGACSWVGPGVTAHRNAVLAAGSVTSTDLEENGVYRGNPAVRVTDRFKSQTQNRTGQS